jgi:hypothetical protein
LPLGLFTVAGAIIAAIDDTGAAAPSNVLTLRRCSAADR